MENEKLPRREREKLRQRQEMLAAALDLFSEKGYHNVSMHQVAEKAEFAIGTLYKFFQNKEDLYKALVLGECDKFHDALVRAMEKRMARSKNCEITSAPKANCFAAIFPSFACTLPRAEGRASTSRPAWMRRCARDITISWRDWPQFLRAESRQTVQGHRRPLLFGCCSRQRRQRLSSSLARRAGAPSLPGRSGHRFEYFLQGAGRPVIRGILLNAHYRYFGGLDATEQERL